MPSCANQVEEEGSDDHVKEEDSTVKEEEKQEDRVKEEGKGGPGPGDLFWSGVWSSHKCDGPGISAHTEQCSKFWLCRQLGEGEGLQVKSFSSSISIFESILPAKVLLYYKTKTDVGSCNISSHSVSQLLFCCF